MSGFSIRNPYFVVVVSLIAAVVGLTSLVRMPVDLFPDINIPQVVVATFYTGMPPEQIETDITGRFERFFTLASGVDHIESRSLPGVSLIKIYFQPGFDADSAVTSIANLALADLRKLPPGTLPPVVLKFDASSLPVCLVTLKGAGLNEARLRDLGQYDVRNQIASVPGASVPQPFGGRYRQIMVYVDPLKLQAHQLSVMDVVRTVNEANLILPAGDVKIGPYDYNLYANSQIDAMADINRLPLKTVGNASVLVADVGKAQDAAQIQYNIVRVDGQPSVYLPVLKQGGDANTIAVVDGIRHGVANLLDVPKQLIASVVFDQSQFVRNAIENLIHEGVIGLALTGIMILVFLGSLRATAAVFLSIPLSALAAFIALSFGDGTINTMILGGLALAFSRLIDNSVVVLENIFRHLELGEAPTVAAERGGEEVQLPVLAATLTTAIVFFPVIFLYGVSRFLFTALALAVVLSLFASYFVAMTVVPLFCARFIKAHQVEAHEIEVQDILPDDSATTHSAPALQLNIDRERASELGLNEKEVVGNVITALTSNAMIAPSYWVDPKSGNDYLLTVQYPEDYIHNLADLRAVPLRGPNAGQVTQLDTVSSIRHIESPTEVDHYQLRREMDVYVSPSGEDLSGVLRGIEHTIQGINLPEGVRVKIRGSVQAMRTSFTAFGLGLILATLLVYLVLVAQFKSFLDPLLILLAVPTGLTGVLLTLFLTGTTLNIMSLMGVVMMVGIVVSNSILIVEFTNRLRAQGHALREAVSLACRVRLRPVLMTSLATLIGLIPLALKLGTGAEAYAPLARAIIGGLAVSVVLTVFIVPAAYYLAHRGADQRHTA